MRFPPPSVIESWPTPDYTHPETQKPYLIPVLALLTFAATCMVLLRLYTRFFHSHTGSDDWIVVVAIIPGIAYTVVISIAVTNFGWDRHIWDIPPGPENINSVRERAISWASQMLYVWTSNLTKISLLCFYRRAFTTPMMQKVVTWVLASTATFTVVCVVLLCTECQPLNFYWEEFRIPQPHGHCGVEGIGLMTTGLINVILDLIILILPIRTVLTLNILWAQKVQVLSIFAAGILIVICSTIRVYEVWETTEVTYDVTWKGYNAYLFTGIELYVGIICACLPACRGLLKQWRESARQASRASDSDGKHDYTTKIDSAHASMPPLNGIQKRTRTTVDVTYMKMDDQNPTNEKGNQLGPRISYMGSSIVGDGTTNIWGADGCATNITKAWAGKEKEKVRRASSMGEEKLALCANPVMAEVTVDKGGKSRVTFEDERSSSKEGWCGKEE